MIGRSLSRYSSATVASTKTGSPTGTSRSSTPASRSAVMAETDTCHEVRSSDRRMVVVARPLASVARARKATVSRKSLRTLAVVSPPSPSEPASTGTWWVEVRRTMPLSTGA